MPLNAFLDSSIMQKGQIASAGSFMLSDFVSPVDAAVVEALLAAGVKVAGRVESGEFGVGGLLLTDTDNAGNDTLIDTIIKGEADFVLCNDYTGSVSRSAAAAGLFYLHPTYGTVSRYGLIQSVSSMDQIGVLCKNAETGFKVLGIIAGYDIRDGIMISNKEDNIYPHEFRSHEVKKNYLPHHKLAYSDIFPQIMQILCCAELSNNISRYDGIKFGHRAREYNGLHELYTKSRTEAFCEDVKLAAIIGSMVLSQENYERYYNKAMQLRRLIKDSLEFDKYDVIKTDCPVLSRLCGLPSLTTPEFVYIADTGREDILEVISYDV